MSIAPVLGPPIPGGGRRRTPGWKARTSGRTELREKLEIGAAAPPSDVPVGAWLSGGIDSSAVASLMRDAAPQPVPTFTIGFENPQYDEASKTGS